MNAAATKGTAVITTPTDTQIKIVREFNAPRHLVYKAYTTPELIRRWWAGRRGEVHTAEVDLRVGGRWRYAMTAQGGLDVAFNGEYREIVENERLVFTESYEAMPDAPPLVVTVTFDEADGRTTLTSLIDHPDQETRDAVLNSGMEVGVQEGYDIIEELAIDLAG